MQLTDYEFLLILEFLQNNYGIDMTKKRFLVESKLSIELLKKNINSFKTYWHMLCHDVTGELKQQLIDIMTTNYSYFYREEAHLNFLCRHAVPEVSKSHTGMIYIWCAGCAAGQEAYTLAMQMMECQRSGVFSGDFTIIATDISRRSLETAQAGIYGMSDYVRLPKAWQQNYCMLVKYPAGGNHGQYWNLIQ